MASSTRTTLQASARSSGGGCRCLPCLSSLLSMVHTHKPPYEQLLVGVVAGGVSSFHPSSTP
jgi:hypothetical protein